MLLDTLREFLSERGGLFDFAKGRNGSRSDNGSWGPREMPRWEVGGCVAARRATYSVVLGLSSG